MSLVESIQIMSVADLYEQYGRFARSYELADNPLRELTLRIPRSAEFYTIVSETNTEMAQTLMRRVAGRRKLRTTRAHKDDIRHAAFVPVSMMVIFYA
jgi:hypothetical protein